MVTHTLAAPAASQEPVAAPRPFLGELLVQAGRAADQPVFQQVGFHRYV